MGDLKDSWKNTGVGLGHAFRDLGKSLLKTGATAINKADEWANGDAQPAQSPNGEPVINVEAVDKDEQ